MITLGEFIQSRHGHRPFDVAFVEHIKLDVELVCSWAKVNLGNAWVTFLIDSYSRRILANYLTFDPPNYRSCMMVMRVCVRRYERLPTTIVVHKGKEFCNVHFERFLETYYCRKQTILEAEPRFGSICERLFGSANAMLIRNIQGNTQVNSNAEGTTKSIKSQSLAVCTLKGLYQNLCRWAYEFYDKKEHPDLGLSPYEAFKKGLLKKGLHSHNKRIVFDEEFRISTLPTTSKGIATVRPGFGVKINNIYYWHNNFQHPDVEGNQVAVCYDPYDIGTAYAYINKHWVSCISQYYASFAGHSEKEMMLVIEELRKLHKNSSKRFVVTASSLFNYLNQEEIDEQVILQRVRDMEARFLLSEIDFGHVQEYRQGTEEVFVFYANIERVMPQQGDESEEIKPYDEFW
jgi:putative transposase